MSLKGKVFTEADAPRRVRARGGAGARVWAEAQTARYRIVAYDRAAREARQPLIAEELEARALARLTPKARRIAGMLARATPDVRGEVLAAFEAGLVRLPFEPVGV